MSRILYPLYVLYNLLRGLVVGAKAPGRKARSELCVTRRCPPPPPSKPCPADKWRARRWRGR
eukprot:1002508-Prorocentrum_minimum.AAC.1